MVDIIKNVMGRVYSMRRTIGGSSSLGSIFEASVYSRDHVRPSKGSHSIIEAKTYGKKNRKESLLEKWTKIKNK